jgi:dynein heavy chain
MTEFGADLVRIFSEAGGKKQPTVFLLTDSQVMDEQFLIPVSDFLSTGVIPDVFAPEDKENVYGMIKGDIKIASIQFGPEDAWKFFIERVRQYLRIVFCQSPSGDTFCIRAHRLPALVNCMIIDWFHPWPDERCIRLRRVSCQMLILTTTIRSVHCERTFEGYSNISRLLGS